MNDSAVSEVVGFMIIFGIMLTGIGLITMYGYPMLMQEQQNTNIRNMERNMIVLQNDLNSLTYKNVPYQETTLQVAGGTLSVTPLGMTPDFTIDVDGTTYNYPLGEIHYESQDGTTTISLENGAVHTRLWSSPTGSTMLSDPRWFYDPSTKTFVMTFIRINSSDYLAQTGIGTVRMKLVPDTQIPPIDVTGRTVIVTYTGDITNNYNIAWRNYFNNLNMMPIDVTSDLSSTFALDPSVETLVIKQYNVTVLSL
jgi:hypothetical protein